MPGFTARVTTKAVITLLLCLATALSAHGNEPSPRLNELLTRSGYSEQIYQFSNVMKQSISRIHQLGLCDQRSRDIITRSIEVAISPEFISSQLSSDLTRQVTPEEIDKLLAWYESPLGSRIANLEIASSHPETHPRMKQEAEKLFANTKRVELAKKINEISEGTRWAVNIEMQSKIAMLSALAQIQKKPIGANLVELASQLEEQKAEMAPYVEEAILLWYLYTYQDLKEEEINQYISFLATEKSRHFNRVALDSIASSITKVTEDFLVDIAKSAKE